LQQELRELNAFKQSDRKVFDSNPVNEKRIDELKRLRKNYQRSQEMSESLEAVGLSDNVVNNDLIINHILDVGQEINSSNRVQYVSTLKGPDGDLKVLSTFRVFDDGSKYLSSINFIPITR
jgi:hypothetical protein